MCNFFNGLFGPRLFWCPATTHLFQLRVIEHTSCVSLICVAVSQAWTHARVASSSSFNVLKVFTISISRFFISYKSSTILFFHLGFPWFQACVTRLFVIHAETSVTCCARHNSSMLFLFFYIIKSFSLLLIIQSLVWGLVLIFLTRIEPLVYNGSVVSYLESHSAFLLYVTRLSCYLISFYLVSYFVSRCFSCPATLQPLI